MSRSSRGWAVISFSLATVLVILACGVSVNGPEPAASSAPVYDATKAALEIQATQASLQLTQVALNAQAQQPPAQPAVEQPTQPVVVPPTESLPVAIPTTDIEAKIKAAKVLVYENTDERGIGMWVQDALEGLGMDYTDTGSYSGHFMEYLDSGTKYDLIIVDAEDKDVISGEFWDVINTRLARDKAALIAEVWYLDTEANGPIGKILGGCGVRYRVDMPLDSSIYWWDPTHEVFNQPNTVLPLLHYNLYWSKQAGDKLMLAGGDAKMLAGLSAKPSSGEGVLATCYGGRVIIATYSDHDYHQSDIVPLWQNFIHYTLKNHFLAIQQ